MKINGFVGMCGGVRQELGEERNAAIKERRADSKSPGNHFFCISSSGKKSAPQL